MGDREVQSPARSFRIEIDGVGHRDAELDRRVTVAVAATASLTIVAAADANDQRACRPPGPGAP